MKHHDSIALADKKLALSIEQLRQWQLAATPINYAVSYEYISGKNQALHATIKQQLASGNALDSFFMEEVYKQFVLGQSSLRDEMISDIDNLLSTVENGSKQSTASINGFITSLDANISAIHSDNKKTVDIGLAKLRKSSLAFKTQQQELITQLNKSHKHASTLRNELEELRKEIFLDPLTQLYNRKAMSKHLDLWHSEDPNKQIAALVINIDHFTKFSQRFGPLIGDVLLSKIAKKISSYVDNSGLPIRSGGDEFLILLPDVERSIAAEIAEKIRQGVEKLRFVSSKSGIRLPSMTVSIGVSDFRVSKNINAVISQSRQVFDSHKTNSANKVILATV